VSEALRQEEREQLLRELASGEEELRRQAALRLHLLPPEEAAAHWLACLGDPDWRVRKVATQQLAARASEAAVLDALVAALADGENPGRRNSAAEALVRAGARAVPQLVAALDSRDPDLRKLAVDALARLDDARSAAPLAARLRDPDANVRAAAAEALGSVGGGGAVAALFEAAAREAEDPLVRLAALRALDAQEAVARAPELASALAHPLLRPAALGLLARSDDALSRKQLIEALSDRSRSAREAAMRALLALAAADDDPDLAGLREQVRGALAGSSVVADACGRLAEASLSAQLVLVQFLGLAGDAAATRPLLEAARDDALADLCAGALAALGEPAAQVLADAWARLDTRARVLACAALGRSRGPAGDALLAAALESASPELRVAAARACSERGQDEVLPALVRGLERAAADADADEGEECFALGSAIVSLAARDGREQAARGAAALLRERIRSARDPARAVLAQYWCQAAGAEDAELAAALLRDPAPALRAAAALALARAGAQGAGERLRLAAADESAEVRRAAAQALRHGSELPDALLALAHDADPLVRAAALRSLAPRLSAGLPPETRAAAHAAVVAGLGGPVPVALAAAEALRAGGSAMLQSARVLLESSEVELVSEAIRCVAESRDPDELARLVPLLSHPDWSLRAEALEALSRQRFRRALPAMLRRLELEQDAFVRDALLRAIRRLEA